jgi:hypothetical protein
MRWQHPWFSRQALDVEAAQEVTSGDWLTLVGESEAGCQHHQNLLRRDAALSELWQRNCAMPFC